MNGRSRASVFGATQDRSKAGVACRDMVSVPCAPHLRPQALLSIQLTYVRRNATNCLSNPHRLMLRALQGDCKDYPQRCPQKMWITPPVRRRVTYRCARMAGRCPRTRCTRRSRCLATDRRPGRGARPLYVVRIRRTGARITSRSRGSAIELAGGVAYAQSWFCRTP